jgi:rhodanese-related sulfurtransferase
MKRAAHAFKAALHGAVLFCAVLCSVGLLPGAAWAQNADVMSLDEAKQLWDTKQAILIDIREPQEHATGVAQGALLIPMSQLSRRLQDIPKLEDARGLPVLLICNTQNRSSSVLRAIRQQLGAPYAHLRYVHGGMSEWAKRGWPMVKP